MGEHVTRVHTDTPQQPMYFYSTVSLTSDQKEMSKEDKEFFLLFKRVPLTHPYFMQPSDNSVSFYPSNKLSLMIDPVSTCG